MSDNARCYSTSHQFARALTELGARHILIPPRAPRWNGKIERFFRTLDTEWAHGRVWPNSATRDRALSSFMRFYNRRRPHSAAAGRPPIARVHQVRRQNYERQRPHMNRWRVRHRFRSVLIAAADAATACGAGAT
jgi:hypothetical protein